ncbi:transporter [Sandaracinobacter sp. RS1-74]|uniref:transporter n=1 Tax=Sandaracinobacteroides sayramensis TaxID=2913411 RepID=UPI001EDC07F0|nr:transporter [Sandaracinobacteroides sayramensis]MCG2839569.1 transporter [Sandaracinobacteroides sayramensis]
MPKLQPALMMAAGLALAATATPAMADGARDWINAPKNMNFLYGYYAYSNSDTSFDQALPISGASVDVHMPILRYARSLSIAGQTGGFQVVVPFAFVSAEIDGTRARTSRNGLGDIQASFIANFFGAPALDIREFATWKPEPFLTGSFWVTAPTGSYDSDRAVNIGKNRWAFKPQLSYGMPVGTGGLFSANANAQFFTDNKDGARDRVLAQKPLWTLEGHFSQNLSPSFWLSADAFYHNGGETKVNGLDQENAQSTLRLGGSGSFNITPVNAVSVALSTSVAKRDHTPKNTGLSVSISHAW